MDSDLLAFEQNVLSDFYTFCAILLSSAVVSRHTLGHFSYVSIMSKSRKTLGPACSTCLGERNFRHDTDKDGNLPQGTPHWAVPSSDESPTRNVEFS